MQLESATPLDGLKASIAGYLRPADIERIEEAYRFSDDAHRGQFRQSGEAYIHHPIAVAEILSAWQLDPHTLSAALLHDVMEDTHVSKDELARRFGRPVADLVDGVSKLDRIEFQSAQEAQAENFRKMLLAMARDVRVILIKLADRLHNMRTLDAVSPAKRRRVAPPRSAVVWHARRSRSTRRSRAGSDSTRSTANCRTSPSVTSTRCATG